MKFLKRLQQQKSMFDYDKWQSMEEKRQLVLRRMSMKPRVNLSMLDEYREIQNKSPSIY